MLETGLETISRNINHRNENLKLFEFGKTYRLSNNEYNEEDHLALFTTGVVQSVSWNNKEIDADLFFLKGVIKSLALQSGIQHISFQQTTHSKFDVVLEGTADSDALVSIYKPNEQLLKKYDIKISVWYADIHWKNWMGASRKSNIRYKEISKFPSVHRDLSFVANTTLTYAEIEKTLTSLSIPQLRSFGLFDVFKSEKLGKDKQSLAMNFVFMDEGKTMKDEEVEKMMNKITTQIEKQFQAEIRK